MNRFVAILLLLSGCSLPVRPAAVGHYTPGSEVLKAEAAPTQNGLVTPSAHGGRAIETLTSEPAPVNPYAALTWTHRAEQFPFQHIVWQRANPTGPEQAVAIVTTPCDATGTNFCIDLPRTNSQAFYRVSAQWR